MKKIIKKIILFLDDTVFRWIVKWLYPQYKRPRYGYMLNIHVLLRYAIMQKIFRINGSVPWPVDFRSKVAGWKNIKKGIMCDPGDSIGCYIQALNGIEFGSNVEIAPGVKIISANHDFNDYRKHIIYSNNPIKIGSNVWIGANVIILPGVQIGDNVIIGAGSVVVKNIPSDCIAVGNPCKVIKKKPPYGIDVYNLELN